MTGKLLFTALDRLCSNYQSLACKVGKKSGLEKCGQDQSLGQEKKKKLKFFVLNLKFWIPVMLLPTVKPSMLPSMTCPLLVFVNGKSGGGQGLQLINSFRKLLNPHQVFDLCNGGPLCGWEIFAYFFDQFHLLKMYTVWPRLVRPHLVLTSI